MGEDSTRRTDGRIDQGLAQRPFAQLERCHRRLEEAIAALRTAAREHDIVTASDISAFFGRQIRRHEEDEERSLFPRLLTHLTGARPEIRASIERLSGEHRTHEALHTRLERAVSGRDDQPGDPWTELAAIADELGRSYAGHIEEEETVLFPAARESLNENDLEAIAAEMEARRGR